jgi:hypothetical protein
LYNGGLYRFCAHGADFLSSTTPIDKTVSDLFVPACTTAKSALPFPFRMRRENNTAKVHLTLGILPQFAGRLWLNYQSYFPMKMQLGYGIRVVSAGSDLQKWNP